jgi:large subunit ribosomal protein L25
VNLALNPGEYTALIRDVQYDPLSHKILHLDFQHISLTETVEVEVTVHLIGIPTGVKDGGGILEPILRQVEVRCLPTQIPSSIDVDVTALAIGDSVHARDLKVENVTILTDPDATVATVVPPTVMEEKPADEAAAAAAEPEVIAKGKKDEEGDEKDKDKEKKEKK